MITLQMRVISCGEIETLTKQDGSQSQKRQIRLQELGGYSRYDNPAQNVGNALVAVMFGNLAQCMFYPNEIVTVVVKPSIRNYQGAWYQDLTVVDIIKLSK